MMSPVLVTREELEDRAIAHYRTPGSKNGERLYQYKDGSLTPLGRIHYGVGLGRDRSSGGAISMIVGKKQVNKDGSLTKQGIKAVEETMRSGSYLNPSQKEVKSGHAKEREKIVKARQKEYWEAVGGEDKDPDSLPEEKDRELWDKFKDKYAEATLKDLNLPVNEKNKGAVKDAMKRYDPDYDYVPYDYEHEQEWVDRRKAIEAEHDKRFKTADPSDKEIKKDVETKIENFNKSVKEKADERKTENKERNERLKNEIKEIRTLADEELDKRIARLQKEKQLAELINERNNQEQSELHRRASKIFKDAAENLARRALNVATDELLNKYKNRMNGSNAVKEKNTFNENNKSNNQNKPNNDKNKSDNGGNGNRFSKEEKSRIRSMAGSGKSVAEIAKALGVDENKVKGFMASAGITIS